MQKNPWTKKNPFMSMWLSGANKMMGAARGQMTAAAKRQGSQVEAEMTRQIVDFWTGGAATPKKRKSRR
jgi:hypothetical protein